MEVLGGARALEVVAGAGKRSQHPNYSVSSFVYHPGSMKNSILWYTTSLFRLSPIIKASPLPYKPPTPRLPTMGIQLERGHGPRRCRLLHHRIYRKLDQATSDNDTWLVRNQRKSLLAQHSAIIARRNWLILTMSMRRKCATPTNTHIRMTSSLDGTLSETPSALRQTEVEYKPATWTDSHDRAAGM